MIWRFVLVTVIILNWNGKTLLEKCLPSVLRSTYPHLEIVVADNASTDDSVQWLQEHAPSVRIIQHPENGGYSKGNNDAMKQVDSEYIVLLNNDVEVEPNWLEPLVALMESMPHVAAVQPKLLQYDKRDTFEYAGASGGFIDRYGYPFTRGRIFFDLEQDEGQYNTATPIFWATGAAIMLRKKALDQFDPVEWLDEAFFMHFEEIDLCWRLQRCGWQIMVEPKSVVYHIGGASLPQGNARKTYYNFRNSLLMLYKNRTQSEFRRIFGVRICLDFLAWIRALSAFSGEASAILKAYRDFWQARKMYQRPTYETNAIQPFQENIYQKSIVWTYFVHKIKKFKDLSFH